MSSYSTSADQSAVMQSDAAASTAPTSTVPDLVKIGSIPSNTAIDIETDVLDPVVMNESICRFQLQNKGILHSHSKIVLRMANNGEKSYLPIGVGIHSLIQRCVLRIGTKTVSEIDDYNHYLGYKSLFMSNEHQKEREQLTSGRAISHGIYYNDGGNASSVGQSNTSASFVGLDLGYGYEKTGTKASPGTSDSNAVLELLPCQRTNGLVGPDAATTFNGPEYQIALADLFPFLYTNQLPLYMISEPVTIELTFSERKFRLSAGGTGSAVGASAALDLTATQLIADYQYFPQEIMESYARENADMTFTYVDYRLAKRNVVQKSASGAEVGSGQQIMNIGAAGRICSKVVTMLSNDGIDEVSLVNNFHSMGAMREVNGTDAENYNGKLTANIKYNNQFLYPVDINNSARLFNAVVSAEGMVPFVVREEYGYEGKQISPIDFEGLAQNGVDHQGNAYGLPNKFFYQAYHLNRNERVNSRGLEYYFDYDKLQNYSTAKDSDAANAVGAKGNSYTLRTYVELMKVATLKNGMIETFFA